MISPAEQLASDLTTFLSDKFPKASVIDLMLIAEASAMVSAAFAQMVGEKFTETRDKAEVLKAAHAAERTV